MGLCGMLSCGGNTEPPQDSIGNFLGLYITSDKVVKIRPNYRIFSPKSFAGPKAKASASAPGGQEPANGDPTVCFMTHHGLGFRV